MSDALTGTDTMIDSICMNEDMNKSSHPSEFSSLLSMFTIFI